MHSNLTAQLKSVLRRVSSQSKSPKEQDIEAAIRLQPLAGDLYLPWTSSSMNPSAIAGLLNDIEINNRLTIVECGSGISTFFLARVLSEKKGARLVTIDHDEKFLGIVRRWIGQAGLGHCVEFVHAPIEKLPIRIGEGYWYDTRVLDHHFENGDSFWQDVTIDMLVVDGPPAWQKGKELARLPAGAYFNSRLSESFSVFLDDINRKGEREVARRWKSVLGVKMFELVGGIGHGQRGQGYTIV